MATLTREQQREREDFLITMQAEGMHPDIARRILRHANTIQRLAVLACSSEAADRDQVRCPGSAGCLCRDYGSYKQAECPAFHDDPSPCLLTPSACAVEHVHRGEHGTVPRYLVREARAQRHISALCGRLGIIPKFQGDPRGACVQLTVPSGKTDDMGRTGVCVPTRRY